MAKFTEITVTKIWGVERKAGNDTIHLTGIEGSCLSTDTKPTAGIATGSILVEADTGSVFMYAEGTGWVEQFSLQS